MVNSVAVVGEFGLKILFGEAVDGAGGAAEERAVEHHEGSGDRLIEVGHFGGVVVADLGDELAGEGEADEFEALVAELGEMFFGAGGLEDGFEENFD